MRNAVLVRAVAGRTSRAAAFVVLYADALGRKIPRWLESSDWQEFYQLFSQTKRPVMCFRFNGS
jgi:hypothetical protein